MTSLDKYLEIIKKRIFRKRGSNGMAPTYGLRNIAPLLDETLTYKELTSISIAYEPQNTLVENPGDMLRCGF